MATDLAKLVVSLEAQNTQMLQKLEQTEKRVAAWEKRVSKSVSTVGNVFKGLLVGGAALRGFSAVIKASAESEKAIAQLETALKSTGGVVGMTSQQMQAFAADLQRSTTFDDEAIIDLQTRLLSFGNVTGDVFKRTTQAALDMSTRLGKDLPASALQLGKALNDPIKGLAGLAKAGVQFSAGQRELIQSLAESGRLAEAQGVILDELEKKFGGAAEAARNTMGGAMQALQNAFGNLLEAPGGMQDATAALNDFTKQLEDPRTVQAANALSAGVVKAFSEITSALATVINGTHNFGENLAKLIHGTDVFGMSSEDAAKRLDILTKAQEEADRLSPHRNRDSRAERMRLQEIEQLKARIELEKNLVNVRKSATVGLKSTDGISKTMSEADALMAAPGRGAKGPSLKSSRGASAMFDAADDALNEHLANLNRAAEIKLSLMSEEDQALARLQASYIELQTLVEKNALTQDQAAQMSAQYAQAWAEDQKAAQQAAQDTLLQGLLTEEEMLAQSYLRRREAILSSSVGTAELRNEAIKRLDEQYAEESLALNGDYWDRWLAAAEENLTSLDKLTGDMLNNMASQFGNVLEEVVFDFTSLQDAASKFAEGMARTIINALGQMAAQWLIYKAVQAASQGTAASAAAAAMGAQAQAQSVMASLNAFSSTAAIPITGPALAPGAAAAALAATQPMAASVAALAASAAASSFAGAFDLGGTIPMGKFGLVGERGPELVSGPATVTGRMDTARVFDFAAQQPQESGRGGVRIVNAFDTGVIGEYLGSAAGEQLVLNVVQRNGRKVRSVLG